MKRFIVTGATGLLGSALTIRLLDMGHQVVGVKRDSKPFSRLQLENRAQEVLFAAVDLTQPTQVRRMLFEYQPDCLVHLAASPIVSTALADPFSVWENNVRASYTLLECVRAYGPLPLIVASTDKVYGDGAPPLAEEAPLLAKYPYDVSKLCVDRLAQCYAHTYGLPIAVIRPANIYGPGDFHYTRLIPGAIFSLLADRAPIIRSSGQPVRDFIFVDDVVEALVRIVNRLQDTDGTSCIYNIGSGRPHTVLDIVTRLIRVAGKQCAPIIQDRELKEINAQYLDITRMKQALSFTPAIALTDGLERTYQWYHAVQKRHGSLPVIP